MTVYLDELMLLNFLMDRILLEAVNRLAGGGAGTIRLTLGAGLGGIYGGAVFLPGVELLRNLFSQGTAAWLMILTAFGQRGKILRKTGLLWI